MLTHEKIKKSIIKSQHCQRNWDLEKQIPEKDLELLMHAVTNCPSKQNVAFYDVHFVTDRNKIEKIHEKTNGFTVNPNLGITTTTTTIGEPSKDAPTTMQVELTDSKGKKMVFGSS